MGSVENKDDINVIAHEVAKDIITYLRDESFRTNSLYALALRRKVNDVIEKYKNEFYEMMKKLDACNNSQDVCRFLNSVFNEMFFDNEINWGRIVTVYSFTALISKSYIVKPEWIQDITFFLGNYVSVKCGEWIYKNGGW